MSYRYGLRLKTSNFPLCILSGLSTLLFFFLEEINICLEEVLLAVMSVFGSGMISRDGEQRNTKQQDRKKQMVFNKHWMDRVWNLICLSHCPMYLCPCLWVSLYVFPSGPPLKLIKTLLCLYIHTCVYSFSLCCALKKSEAVPPLFNKIRHVERRAGRAPD